MSRVTKVLLATTLIACHAAPAPRGPGGDLPDDEPVGEPPSELVVASIDPPLPRAGPSLRQARIALARAATEQELLAGHLAIALTADDAATEILIRDMADPETCPAAATATAFLPAKQARRPLWLALRLDCAASVAPVAGTALGLDAMVSAARDAEELARPPERDDENAPDPDSRCDAVATTLRASPSPDSPLPTLLAQLQSGRWSLPLSDDELCEDATLSAAIRLHRGDRAVQLAFDLRLDAPEELPGHLVAFIDRFGLGGVSPRVAARAEEGRGAVCRALVRAGRIAEVEDLLRTTPERVPLCLDDAVSAFTNRDDPASTATLGTIARSVHHRGCAAAALAAAGALASRHVRPPPWTRDPTALGSAIAATLARARLGEGLSAERLAALHDLAFALLGREDPEPPADDLIRLYQRDLRTVLPAANGASRRSLQRLLEEGQR